MNKLNLSNIVKSGLDSLREARVKDIELGLDVMDWNEEKNKLELANDCIGFKNISASVQAGKRDPLNEKRKA